MTDQPATVTLTIDGIEVTVPQNTTILEAARLVGIDIPIICAHDATTANGLCRICVVDVNGGRLLQPACIVGCMDGMTVETGNSRVAASRRTILEMLNASVDLSESPEIQGYMDQYSADQLRFPDAKKREFPIYDDNAFYIRDYSKCLMCWRCVQVCADDAQYIFALSIDSRGFNSHITTAFDVTMPESTCVFCGQCVGVCPTNALKPKIQYGLELGMTPEEIRQSNRGMRKRGKKNEG